MVVAIWRAMIEQNLPTELRGAQEPKRSEYDSATGNQRRSQLTIRVLSSALNVGLEKSSKDLTIS